MDFIEQLFGLSPDNGDGTTEILWLVVLAILFVAAFRWQRSRAGMLRRRLIGAERSLDEEFRFSCIERTCVGDQDAVLVTANRDLIDGADLIGEIVLIDERHYVVREVRPRGQPVKRGQTLMMKVEKL